RAWLDKVLNNGFVDVFRKTYPEAVKYTYWDMKTMARDRNVGWRIDYFFVNKNFFSKIKKVEIMDDVFGSDHCPILLEI
ncbi:MAG: exodeoxyribonuclease, partial [Patescibacteria group bacterium]|nr:exodeoxyribonuclease [Patescibacteria group bacterium]